MTEKASEPAGILLAVVSLFAVPRRELVAAVLLLPLVASYRFLSLTGFPDDHYVHMAGAQQMLYGAWPSRDFVDLGAPFTYALSAAAQVLFGRGMDVEAALMAIAFGVAAILLLRAVVLVTGSVALGVSSVAIEVLTFPRTYSYPKLLLYGLAAVCLVSVVRRPRMGGAVGLAGLTALAFLFRHDHGAYIGAASVVALVMAPPAAMSRARILLVWVACVAVVLLPYAVYLQTSGGVVAHVLRGVTFARLEMPRQRLSLEGISLPEAWLLGVAWSAPLLTAVVVAIRGISRHPRSWDDLRVAAPLCVLAVIANLGLIRDSLAVRLPDAMVLPLLLQAWLVALAWREGRPRWATRGAALAVVVGGLVSASLMGATVEQLDRAGLFSRPELLARRFGERTRELRRPWVGRQVPSAAVRQMGPFFEYVGRCVPEQDRLLVPGFLPEVAVTAGRAFAGGQVWFMAGTVNTPDDHRRVMSRLATERVPLAVVRRPSFDALEQEFPALAAYVARFDTVAEWPLGGSDRVLLGADLRLATGVDATTGWPCFR